MTPALCALALVPLSLLIAFTGAAIDRRRR